MPIAKRVWFAFVLVAGLAGTVTTTAREDYVAEGQILRLDPTARKMVIQTVHGSQLQCTYNGETRVIGASETVATLRALSHVTVHYSKEEMEYLATEIEVQE